MALFLPSQRLSGHVIDGINFRHNLHGNFGPDECPGKRGAKLTTCSSQFRSLESWALQRLACLANLLSEDSSICRNVLVWPIWSTPTYARVITVSSLMSHHSYQLSLSLLHSPWQACRNSVRNLLLGSFRIFVYAFRYRTSTREYCATF